MQLYAVAVEDTVFYEAPNGEKEHHNVFRKVLVNEALMIPSTVGDSVVFIAKTANKAEWNASRMYVMAFAQTADKRVEQVASSEGDADIDKGGGTNGVDDIARETRFFLPKSSIEHIASIINPKDGCDNCCRFRCFGSNSFNHSGGRLRTESNFASGLY